jgi:hypothetical protein
VQDEKVKKELTQQVLELKQIAQHTQMQTEPKEHFEVVLDPSGGRC